MNRILLWSLALLGAAVPALAASEVVGSVVNVKAIVDSPVSSTASINWVTIYQPPKIAFWSNVGKNPDVNVEYQIKDDSRTTGYPCAVSASVESYNFSYWRWQPGGGGNGVKGTNTRTGKYNNYGTWRIALNQPTPVTRYRFHAMADTKGKPTKRESREFYAARIAPMGVRNTKVRNAAAKWVAGRYERALMLRGFAGTWNKMKNPSADVNFDLEMTRLIVGCGALFGPTSAGDYLVDSGFEVLDLVSTLFGNAATSGLLASTGAVYQAYSWGSWAKTTLNQADGQLRNQFNASHIKNACTYDYATALNAAADAMRDEANELSRIIWTSPHASDDVWKAKLNAELQKLEALHTAGGNARRDANLYFAALGGQTSWNATLPMPPLPAVAAANRETLIKYLDAVRDLVRAERAILQQAINGSFSQT